MPATASDDGNVGVAVFAEGRESHAATAAPASESMVTANGSAGGSEVTTTAGDVPGAAR